MRDIQRGFFDEEIRLEKLKDSGDPLISLNHYIDWEMFRNQLTSIFKKEAKGSGGRPPYDYVLMFKILILQKLYNLSDKQMEYQINDRLSFMRFLNLTMSDKIPDQNTIWNFREILTNSGKMKDLFNKFEEFLREKKIIANKGSIVDASFVEVPIQRNSREENKKIKNGEIPDEWENSPKKLSQKDTDARWTIKNNRRFYGYKNHAKVDIKSKIITDYGVTSANVHDSQALENLLSEKDRNHLLYADSAYTGKPIKDLLKKLGIINVIHEKGYKGKPLTNIQKIKNRNKSRVRVRVEHIFGFIQNTMNCDHNKAIGVKRNEVIIGLTNMAYNFSRFVQIKKLSEV